MHTRSHSQQQPNIHSSNTSSTRSFLDRVGYESYWQIKRSLSIPLQSSSAATTVTTTTNTTHAAATAAASTLSPMHPTSTTAASLNSSSASSIRDDDAPTTTTDSKASVSSLGGLNHVNNGVGGSTTQRRMSRVFSASEGCSIDRGRMRRTMRCCL
jgi:hypothetical protein